MLCTMTQFEIIHMHVMQSGGDIATELEMNAKKEMIRFMFFSLLPFFFLHGAIKNQSAAWITFNNNVEYLKAFRVWNRLEIHEIEITAELRQSQIIDIAAFIYSCTKKLSDRNKTQRREKWKRHSRLVGVDDVECKTRWKIDNNVLNFSFYVSFSPFLM